MTRVTGRNRPRCGCVPCTEARAARDLYRWEMELREQRASPGRVAVVAPVLVICALLAALAAAMWLIAP
jgi:hypothetical protein